MPYRIVKVVGGYKVGLADGGKMSNGKRFLSNKILTKKQAEAQKKAVEISESKKKNVSKSNGTITSRRKVEKKQTSVPAKKKY
jgi:hypothetical protein